MQATQNGPRNNIVDPQREIHCFVLKQRTGKNICPSEVYFLLSVDMNLYIILYVYIYHIYIDIYQCRYICGCKHHVIEMHRNRLSVPC